jgi:dephospho-CoA kinase
LEKTPLVIGLAGGVASGKSLVAQCFKHFGAYVLDADRLGHQVLMETDVVTAIQSRWGIDVLENGEVDRSRLARIVFGPDASAAIELEHLENITHPRIGFLIREQLAMLADNRQIAIVLDAPLMFKAGWDRLCDKIVFVDADNSIRRQRALQRGWDDDELAKREARQTPIREKRARSTDIIENSQSRIETYEQAVALWQSWNLTLPNELASPYSLFPK